MGFGVTSENHPSVTGSPFLICAQRGLGGRLASQKPNQTKTGPILRYPSVTPRFVALVLLILKLRLSLPSLPRAMRQIAKTTLGAGLSLCWAFLVKTVWETLRVPGLAPKPPAR